MVGSLLRSAHDVRCKTSHKLQAAAGGRRGKGGGVGSVKSLAIIAFEDFIKPHKKILFSSLLPTFTALTTSSTSIIFKL